MRASKQTGNIFLSAECFGLLSPESSSSSAGPGCRLHGGLDRSSSTNYSRSWTPRAGNFVILHLSVSKSILETSRDFTAAEMDSDANLKCKIVVVGDSQCGKTALLSVFAKDCFPECYVPTVFDNYTASFDLDMQRVELRLWDTSGSLYYDNVRPLSYPDADAVLICFDISRPETLDSVMKKWTREIEEFCPSTKMLLVGCKSDLRTDLFTKSHNRQTPVSYDQGSNTAKQLSAPYLECSSLQSENSVRDIFHVATMACVSKNNKNMKRRKSSSAAKRMSHGARDTPSVVSAHYQQTKAKTCAVM